MRAITSATGARGAIPRFLLAHLGWILLFAVFVTAGAAAYSWSRTPIYRAEVDVLVAPRVLSDVAAPQPPDMGTEKAIASSGAVLATASSSLRVRGDELFDGLSVTVPVDTNVLQIKYSHRDPREARRRAQGLADAYVLFHSKQQSPSQAIKNSQQGKNSQANKGSAALAGLVQGVVITPAGVPTSPATPNHPVDVAVALIIGLGLGVGTAIVRDRLDDRLRSPQDFEAQAGAPVLALIPAFRSPRADRAGRLVMVRSPGSLVAEAYRNLRTLLLQMATQRGTRTLLVTSPMGKETTTVAANLAVAVAQSGRSVVLVCADLRAPRAHQLFGLDNQVGLTTVVDGHLDLSQALFATPVRELLLVPAGSPADDPGAVLQAPAVRTVLDELRGLADFVVIEAPPVLASADTRVLMDLVEMILLVGDARRSTRAQVRAAARQLELVREKLAGCVLDNVGRRRRLSKRWWLLPTTRDQAGSPTSPSDNGRFVGPVPSATAGAQEAVISNQEASPN